jgi:hypothetical protein
MLSRAQKASRNARIPGQKAQNAAGKAGKTFRKTCKDKREWQAGNADIICGKFRQELRAIKVGKQVGKAGKAGTYDMKT